MQDAGEDARTRGSWLDAVSSALLLLSGDASSVLTGNSAAARLFGRPDLAGAVTPVPLDTVLGAAAALLVARHVEAPVVPAGDWLPLLIEQDGEPRHLAISCRPLGTGWLATIEPRETMGEGSIPDGTFRRLLDQLPIGVDLFDADFRAVFCNAYLIRTLGYYAVNTLPEFDRWFENAYPDPAYRAEAEATWDAAVAAVRAGAPVVDQGEWWVRCEDGQTRRLRFVLQPFGRFYLQVTLDMTERYRADGDLLHLAFFDELTGASTRIHFREEAEARAARCRSDGLPLTLVVVDIDHFKSVNDRFGHGGGDTVLRELVARCRSAAGEGALVARLGGDEFVLVAAPDETRTAEALAEAVLSEIVTAPFAIGAMAAPVTASVGVFAGDPRGRTLDRMVELADGALYAAKRDGRARVRFAAP